jgi:quinohemoprotein ethanol dehydrogenase
MATGRFENDGYVLAFKLGGRATLPKVAERNRDIPEPPAIAATAAQVENGKYKFNATCAVCHGVLAISGGVLSDLRMLTAQKHSIFKAIVYDGAIHGTGMPKFSDLLTEQDVRDIQAYVVERAKQDRAAAAATK